MNHIKIKKARQLTVALRMFIDNKMSYFTQKGHSFSAIRTNISTLSITKSPVAVSYYSFQNKIKKTSIKRWNSFNNGNQPYTNI